jgi:hypothetical protein
MGVLEVTQLNTGQKLQLVPLAAGILLPPTKTLTSVGSASTGATTMNIQSTGSATWLEAGTILTFTGGLLATVALGVKVLTTSTAVTVNALAATIAGALTATTLGYATLFGCKSIGIKKKDTVVDVTEYQDGFGESSRTVSRNYSFPLSVFGILNMRAIEGVIKPQADTLGTFLYALYTNAAGDTYAGPAEVRDLSESGDKADVLRYEFTLQFIGDPVITRLFVP